MAKIVTVDDTPAATKSKAKIITIDDTMPDLRVKREGLQRDPNPANVPVGSGASPEDFRATIGREIPSLLANIGSYAGPAGGAIGSVAGEGLREYSPENFGGEGSGGLGTDLAFNSALPFGLGKVAQMLKSGPKSVIADALASKIGQQSPAVKRLVQASNELSPGFENDARDAQLRGFNASEANLDQTKQIIQKAQDSAKDIKNPIVRYARNSIVFRLGAMAGLGGLSPVAAGVGGSLVLGEAAIKQLTKDPEIASLLIKAIRTPSDNEDSALIGKTLFNALRGTQVTFQNSDGEKQPAMIDKDGNLTYPK